MEYFDYLKDKTGHVEVEGLNIFLPEDLKQSVGHPVLVFESSKKYLLYRDSMHIHSWVGSVWTYMVPPNLDRTTAIKLMAEAIPVFSKKESLENFTEHVFQLHGRFREILASA